MKKHWILIPTVSACLLPLSSIGCQDNKSAMRNAATESVKTSQESQHYFVDHFVLAALKIKEIYRPFIAQYYLFYKEYNNLASSLYELAKEQSIKTFSQNLMDYFAANFDLKNININTFSMNLIKLNWIIKNLLISLSNLNFYLENNPFNNSNKYDDINKGKEQVKSDYKKYLYDENFSITIFESEEIPIINLTKVLNNLLKEIQKQIKNEFLNKFLNDYELAKNNIYDNNNHINLDNNFYTVYDVLLKNVDIDYGLDNILINFIK
ncbi:hypothetical protein [Metamycoplasma neophronis]|uniref:Lipoprotein n=1 Tax=Metamycoplasma neophronis TaxID=872983 RepID=A0ABY2Z0S3_9BACT|nr:hypothetical protein [Metamycoplasma neophronis]TPR54113.1 hypothetical protein FJR74_01585 [Metamycoplasma neophronis]